jgi:5-methylcytosine-specific restriction endonuclease McrA
VDRLEQLVADGASIARICRDLGMTRYAAKRALKRAGLRTQRAVHLHSSREARANGVSRVVRTCPKHGVGPFARDARGTYRCTRCSADAVSKRRRRIKAILIEEAGGRCGLCGYDRCVRALAFHHLDPDTKAFGLAEGGLARSLAQARAEAAKCILLCANCHAEVEAGVTVLPRAQGSVEAADSFARLTAHSPVAQSVERTAVNR